MPANMNTEDTARKLIAANPNSEILKAIGPKIISALLPLARGMLGKLAVRYAAAGVTALVAAMERMGVVSEVGQTAEILGAVALIVSFAVDCVISVISSKLHKTAVIPKALPVDP